MANDTHSSAAPFWTRLATRRDFFRRSAVAGVGAVAVAACAPGKSDAEAQGVNDSHHSGGTMAPNPKAVAAKPQPTMDEMHEAGIKLFPAKTAKHGNQPLEPRMDGGVKVFELTAKKIQWEVTPGELTEAWAYNDMVPGPLIRVTEGDRVRVILHNQLDESTAIHFHGVEVPFLQDGVPFITQKPVKAGENYTYEFTVPNPGSHMYHAHLNSTKQVGLGLLGAFIVDPKVKGPYDSPDVERVMILNDMLGGYTLNGKGFPATEPIVAKQGQTIRVRYMNEGMMIHPMHLHGMHQLVTHKDGWPLPQPYRCDTLNIAPGERYDVTIHATNPGTWAYHCHILPHAESEHGMFGMVTALIVTPPTIA
jgi:FtsP/CotA-like multicopper oxidase with cupredoxin domain